MAALVKEVTAKAAAKLTSSPSPASSAVESCDNKCSPQDRGNSKYLLQVSAGPSYDPSTHRPVIVNGPTPTAFENEHIKCHVKVRIRNYEGLPVSAPSTSPYFSHPSRAKEQYSIGFSFVPKHDIASETAVWGNDFDHPVRDRLPPGFGIAVKIVKEFIDPSIELDAYADQPWLLAPALSCFFAMQIGEKKGVEEWGLPEDLPDVEEHEPILEGGQGSGLQVREELGIPDQVGKRRKFFRSVENRQRFTFEAGRLYQADFFNPYIDFANFSLKLPGLSINCIKYVNDKTHRLRYVFKDNETNQVYFCVVLTLLHGQDLDDAMNEEGRRWQAAAASADFNAASVTPRSQDLNDTQSEGHGVSTASSTQSGLTNPSIGQRSSAGHSAKVSEPPRQLPDQNVQKAYVKQPTNA